MPSRRARVAVVAALAGSAIAVAAVVMSSGGSADRRLRAVFDSATAVVPSQDVRVAGRKVGEIESVELVNGRAVLELAIRDRRAWPLRQGTKARLRQGPAVAQASRYVELEPGPASAPPLPEDTVLTPTQTVAPVEFDDVYRILDRRARRNLKSLLGNFADAVDGRSEQLGSGLHDAGGGLDETAALARQLASDREALRTLFDSGARASGAIARHEDDLRGLVTSAAATLDEIAQHSGATRASLDRMPTTLTVVRDSFRRLDGSVTGLSALVRDIRPGSRRLRDLAPTAARTVTALRDTAPLASSALRRARRATPEIRALLQAGTPFLEKLGDVLPDAASQLTCIRPYAPEIGGFLSTWAGFSKNYDAVNHYNRALAMGIPIANGDPRSSAEVVSQSRGAVRYAFPPPPGSSVDQPWFIPECGNGPEDLDPERDPEARR